MATLTGKLISNTYKDLLQVSNGNSGIDTTLRPISDGEGTDSALQISNSEVLTTGKLTVQGDVSSSGKITADSAVIASQVCASTYYGDGSNLTGITASAPTSVSAYTVNQLTVVSGASFLGKVSGTAAEFSGAVSASTYYATTGIFVGGDAVATSADIQVVSALASANAAAITSINTVVANVSALTSVNAAAITSINSAITSINTVVANVSALTSVNAAAITSINTILEGDISADSGTFNTLVVKTSASVSGDLKVGGLIGVGQATPLKQIHITKSALAEINALTDGANIAVDFDAGQNFAVTLAGNRTLDNPTNADAGQVGSIFIVQDGTGSRTLSYGTSWEFPAGTAPTLSTSINAVDRLDYIVYSSTKIHSVLTKEYS